MCQTPGKTPIHGWKAYQERIAKEAELRIYFQRNQKSNVGVIMGPVSAICGIDIDGPDGEHLLDEIMQGEVIDTCEFQTPGGGRRLLFALPRDVQLPITHFSGQSKHSGLSLLAAGSYTVMPPSTHHTGGVYRWDDHASPEHRPPQIIPKPIVAWALRSQRKTTPRQALSPEAPILEGQPGRDQTLTSMAGAMRKQGATELEILAALTQINQRCVPPLEHSDLQRIAKSVARYQPKPTTISTPPTVETTKMSAVTPAQIQWLWTGWIPRGKLVVLDGDPDLGKSTMLLDLAARISTTGTMPDGSQGLTGSVVLMSAEDGVDDTILPRLLAAQANLAKIESITEVGGKPPIIPEHLTQIEEVINRIQAVLLIIDPLTAYLAADTRSDQEVRTALHPLAKMAHRRRCSVIYLRHLNKGVGTKAIYRGGGSIAIIGAARSGLIVAQHPETPGLRILAHTKSNLSAKQTSLQYSMALTPHGACKIIWEGTSTLGADDLLSPPDLPEERTSKEEAIGFLQAFLLHGPKEAEQCYQVAKSLKISDSTLRRAKLYLRVVSVQTHSSQGQFQGVTWQLPNPTLSDVHTGTPVEMHQP